MKTYVINLKRRKDRRRRIEALLPEQIDPIFTTDWAGPMDGQTLSSESLHGYNLFPWQIESTNMWWNRPLKLGEVGCAISHFLCWRHAYNNNYKEIIIFEDDVEFTENWWEKLQVGLMRLATNQINWDLLYLGYEPIGAPVPVLDGIVKPPYSYGTYAYMLTYRGVEKLAHASYEKNIIPADEFLPAMYIDHPREDVRNVFQKNLCALAFDPVLVLPYQPFLDDSDTENSSFIDILK